MPELPEMQALAERLDAALAGATLTGVEALQFSALKTVVPAADADVGKVVDHVGRRGKYLLLDFTSGPRMIVHLSQGGRVDVEEQTKRTRPKGAVVRLRFDGGPDVLVKEFGTERKAAWWVLEPGDEGPLEGLGPEPFSDEFAELIRTSDDRRRVHTILRDQRTVAGIGRGHSDDILHHARLSPYASLGSLSPEERERLLTAVHEILEAALAGERKRKGGLPAKLSDRFVVHRRAGEPCPRCGEDLRRVWYESHEIVYCPACQTGGKVLADRRLSRIVR
jgi:formamidopyrimidine-DNA glycosylase